MSREQVRNIIKFADVFALELKTTFINARRQRKYCTPTPSKLTKVQ